MLVLEAAVSLPSNSSMLLGTGGLDRILAPAAFKSAATVSLSLKVPAKNTYFEQALQGFQAHNSMPTPLCSRGQAVPCTSLNSS